MNRSGNVVKYTIRSIGFGSSLAIVISYTANKSILWAMLHGIFSWAFVIYAAIVY